MADQERGNTGGQTRASWRPKVSTPPSAASGSAPLRNVNVRTAGQAASKHARRRTSAGVAGTARADETVSPALLAQAADMPVSDEDLEMTEQLEQPTKAKRGRRAGRRRTAAKAKQITFKDRSLQELLLLVAKLLAQTSHRVRQLNGAVFVTALLPASSSVIRSLSEEGKHYAAHTSTLAAALATARAAAKTAKETQEIEDAETKVQAATRDLQACGPPAATNWACLLETLHALPTLHPTTRGALEAIMGLNQDQMPDIDICRIENTAQEEIKKLVFACPDIETTALVRKALATIEGCRLPRGAAPTGAMEDELSDWIGALQMSAK